MSACDIVMINNKNCHGGDPSFSDLGSGRLVTHVPWIQLPSLVKFDHYLPFFYLSVCCLSPKSTFCTQNKRMW